MVNEEVWAGPVEADDPCRVCGKVEPRNVDEETTCEKEAHVDYLLSIYPNWVGYNGTY